MAATSYGVRNKKMNKPTTTSDNIKAEDCLCPICLSILIEPVTMPCNHELCMPCFKQNVQETSLTCPMCRMRISTWSRRATKENMLINQKRWEMIQKAFPEKIRQRLEGKDDSLLDEDLLPPERPLISSPGAIKKEFESQLRRLQEEQQQQRILEQKASERLIKEIQEEEDRLERERLKKLEQQKHNDEILAKALSNQLSNHLNGNEFLIMEENLKSHCNRQIQSSAEKTVTAEQAFPRSKSMNDIPSKPFKHDQFFKKCESICLEDDESRLSSPQVLSEIITIHSADIKKENVEVVYQENGELLKGEEISKNNKNEEEEISRPLSKSCESRQSSSDDSDDSISQEFTHFKPIKVAPKTPPKKMFSGSLVETKVLRVTPFKLDDNNASVSELKQSPIVKRQLDILDREHRLKVSILSKATETMIENKYIHAPLASKRLSFDDNTDTVKKSPRKIFFPLDSNLTIEEQTSTYTYQPPVINPEKSNAVNSPGKVYLMKSNSKHFKKKSTKHKNKQSRPESITEQMKTGNVIRDTPFEVSEAKTSSGMISEKVNRAIKNNQNSELNLFSEETYHPDLNESLATDTDSDNEVQLNIEKVLKKSSIRKKLLILESDTEDNERERLPKKRKHRHTATEYTKENINQPNQLRFKTYKSPSKSHINRNAKLKETCKTQDHNRNKCQINSNNKTTSKQMDEISQEELDHQFALRLQQKLNKETRNVIVRKRDSTDWYEFRSRNQKSLRFKKANCFN